MKTRNKALLLTFGAVLLVAASVFGTLAYLTSTDTVTNTFTVGKVQITLDEADVKLDGTYETNHESRVEENSYKLMPGHTYIKDPTVTVLKGSESSYVRMLVTISNAIELKKVFGDSFLPQNYVTGWDNTTWIPQSMAEKNDSFVVEFRYKETVAAPDSDMVLDDLFEKFTVPGEITKDKLEKLAGLEITVVAHAIQADGFTDADAAWKAFGEQNKA